jgi:hypothetical protein
MVIKEALQKGRLDRGEFGSRARRWFRRATERYGRRGTVVV